MTRTILSLVVLVGITAGLPGCDNAFLSGDEAESAKSGRQHAEGVDEHTADQNRETESHEEHTDHTGESPDRVHLSADQRARLDIQLAEAGSGSATAVVSAPATVAFDSDRVARIGPRLPAKVVEVRADLGDHVAAGETVAILDSVELGQAKARYLTANARYRTRRAAYQRNRKLADDQIISEAKLLESRAKYRQAQAERNAARAELELYGMNDNAIGTISAGQGSQLSRYALTTPVAGTVQQRDLVRGQSVGADDTPVHVVDNSRMWVNIEANENALSRLQTGLTIELSVRPLPEQTFTGEIDWISAELDSKSRTVRVRATVDNPDGLLKTGMFGTARIQTDTKRRFALVPVDAVQRVAERDIVFVPGDESGVFRAVAVQLGDEGNGRVEVREGLNAGDEVVATGSFDLASVLTASGRSAAHSH